MTKILFYHYNQGIHVQVNGEDIGNFLTEQDAMNYIVLNDMIENLIIERQT